MIITDTNVLAALIRRRPEPRVMAWVAEYPFSSLFTTSVTEAKVLYGVALLLGGQRRTALERTAQQMFSEDFAERERPPRHQRPQRRRVRPATPVTKKTPRPTSAGAASQASRCQLPGDHPLSDFSQAL